MGRFNINLNKVMMTDLVNKVANIKPSIKNKKGGLEEEIVYNGPVIADCDKLSPFDSNCNQDLILKVTRLVKDYGFDANGEQYTMELHKVTYIDGSTKIFEIRTSQSYVTIDRVEEVVNYK